MLNKKLILCILSVLVVYVNAQEVAYEDIERSETLSVSGKLEPEWGTTTSYYSVNAFACVPFYDSMSYNVTSPYNRYCTTSVCVFGCHVHIPGGAKITGMEVDGCDSTTTGKVYVDLRQVSWLGNLNTLATVESGTSNTPGCYFWFTTIDATVDNVYNSYLVVVSLKSGDDKTSFNSVRIRYQLQVSPAPSTATFVDVPTSHVFFQYVEALVRSGITSGCDATHFCPNNYVTRGQMAKFLAIALGLNWN